MSSDRIKLATGATTIARPPLSKVKSNAAASPVWAAALAGKSRLDLRTEGGSTGTATVYDISGTGSGPGPPPWQMAGAITAAAAVSDSGVGTIFRASVFAPAADLGSPSHADLLNHLAHPLTAVATAVQAAAAPTAGLSPPRRVAAGRSKKMLTPTPHSGLAAASAGTGPAALATGFRRNGITSAPNVPLPRANGPSTAAGASDSLPCGATESDRGGTHLPAIGSLTRGTARAASPPAAISGQRHSLPSRRSLVSLPSIAGGATAAAAAAVVSGTSGANDEEEEQPIIVSFVPVRSRSVGRGLLLRGTSRYGRGLTATLAAAGGCDEDEDGDSTSTSTSTASRTAGGFMRGIRQFFGKDGTKGPAAAVSARRRAVSDDTVRQDDRSAVAAPAGPAPATAAAAAAAGGTGLAGAAGPEGQAAAVSAAKLASTHAQELERVNRVRHALLAGAPEAGPGGGGRVALDAGTGSGAGALVHSPSRRLDQQQSHVRGSRMLRAGKSFTQRALEDPSNPMFKTARQLAALQDQLAYMEDRDWRERAAESVPMERPILMAEGWKV